ncbi:MAG TPA: RNA polymerase sigma factor [Phycisphaerae bacterium]|nr:RNA polymerase sigma factor [Phycisphaerae bacterium]
MATDEKLLGDFVKGDEAAYAQLVSRYQQELYGFLQRFVGDTAVADDLFQETFIQVYRSAAKFDTSRRLKPWLFTIAANKARDYLRMSQRKTIHSLDGTGGHQMQQTALLDILETPGKPVPEDLMQTEDAEAVRKIVSQMPAMYREVLLLSYFQHFAYKQIAQMLDIPLGTVKSRLHAALASFAELWRARQNGKTSAN